jgi:3'-phosphoadenosine 5'-phosphosulfate sulfotransferase (PAPS reductase)/FAD synthetase
MHMHTPDLTSYDVILVNTSGGKDSSVMAHQVITQAKAAGVVDRVVLVHATFREEWQGTEALVHRQAAALGGIPVEVCRRHEELLDYVARRGKWPSNKARYCTSEFKRAPIDKVITRIATRPGHQVKVLNCMGLRAQESSARAKKVAFERDARRTNSKRLVDVWLPIFSMSTAAVWAYIREHAIEQHEAYALGMPRLSCVFCIFAPRNALLLAGKHNPDLLAEYVAVEKTIGHTFREDQSITEIQEALAAGEQPTAVASWVM